jgi:hypothetical protein
MNYVMYLKSNGRIVGFGASSDGQDVNEYEDETYGIYETSEILNANVYKIKEGAPVLIEDGDFAEEKLEEAKREGFIQVKHNVGTARQEFITELPGQDAIYQAKENEAIAYLAAANPVLTDYPLLNAESGITAATPETLANLWVTLAQQWRSVAAQLEAARMTANASVNLATTVAEVDAALAVLNDAIANLA